MKQDALDPNQYSPEELQQMRQARDQHWLVHLRWMCENQPALTRQLQQQNRLGLYLDLKYQQALEAASQMTQEGTPFPEAMEAVAQSVLAPADGLALSDNPPPPMPAQEQRQLQRHLLEE